MPPFPKQADAGRSRRTILRPALACALAFGMGASAARAAPEGEPAKAPDPQRPCVGLVLGGGGARGAAHIGVLRELERQRIPVCVLTGTSMGAIVGGLYATGRSPDQIEAILREIDWRDVFRDDPPRDALPMRRKDAQLNYRLELEAGLKDGGMVLPTGAIQGQKLGLLLRTLFAGSSRDFDRLPIPFRAVTTDIVSGEAVVPAEGDLATVVRASMAVPAVFAPTELDGRLLVDGGLVDNVPVTLARRMGATHIIAVDVGSPLFGRDQLNNPGDIALQVVSVLMRERTERELSTLLPGDVLLRPAIGDFSATAFPQAHEIIPAGEAATLAAAARLGDLSLPPRDYLAWRSARQQPSAPGGEIAFVEVDASRTRTGGLVERRAEALVGEPFDTARLSEVIGSVYAQDTYARISWEPVERDGRLGLRLMPVDKPWGPTYVNVGLQLSDDFAGRNNYQLVGETLLTGLSQKGGELRALAKLGRVTELSADWFSPLDADRDFYSRLYAGHQARNLPIAPEGAQSAEYRIRRDSVRASLGLQRSSRWNLEAGLGVALHEASPLVGDDALPSLDANSRSVWIRAGWDTLDSLSFPSSGARVGLGVEHFPAAFNDEADGGILRARGDVVWSAGDHHLMLGGRATRTWGEPPGLAAFSTLGGFLNLSGEIEQGRAGPQLAYGRAVYYRRLGESGGLFSNPPYVGASLEAGNTWDDWDEASFDDLIGSGSVFVGIGSPFGPVLLGWGRSSTGASAWSLSFGNLIRSDE